jgi:TonB-linked SusC/RagA family outer membrane protein
MNLWANGLRPSVRTMGYHQMLLKMRITAFLVLLGCLQVQARGYAQISLRETDVPLQKVFKSLQRQSGYHFLFDADLLRREGNVTIDVQNVSLQAALDECLKGKALIYRFIDETVVIQPRADKPPVPGVDDVPQSRMITVRVIDSTGVPLNGATVVIKGTRTAGQTDDLGGLVLHTAAKDPVLVISFIGYQTREVPVRQDPVLVVLHASTNDMGAFTVNVNTGFQQVARDRATGSFSYVDNQLFNRSVSTNVLDRLIGIIPGVYNLNGSTVSSASFVIRGTSTLQSGGSPLVILDNFPYNGDLNNLNPNDIESVTVLKDAAAASIWGAQSGNGLIVITTKKGKLNQRLHVDLNVNTTVQNKPDLYAVRNYLTAPDYMNIEQYLFGQGYYDGNLSSRTFPAESPLVTLLNEQRSGLVSAGQVQTAIDSMKGLDVRKDFLKYMYRKTVKQQYALNLTGGTNNVTYALAASYDANAPSIVGTELKRVSLNSTSTFRPAKGLELAGSINYTAAATTSGGAQAFGNIFYYGSNPLYPYAQLADARGNHLPVAYSYTKDYTDSVQRLGFLNWQYVPLDENNTSHNNSQTKDVLLNVTAKYKILPWLNVNLLYQNEYQTANSTTIYDQQSYYARNLINRYSQYNTSTHKITYAIPLGGILTGNNTETRAYALRGQLNIDKYIDRNNVITAIAGGEVRQAVTEGYSRLAYGYTDALGTGNNILNYNTSYNLNPTSPFNQGQINAPSATVSGTMRRALAYFGNAAYTFMDRYTLSLSGRKDGASQFGIKTNDRVTPLWSTGLSWNISKEGFYHVAWLPYLRTRLTYGFNGNTYPGAAYVTGSYGVRGLTGAQALGGLTAPNPELSWEKVQITNLALEFATKKGILSGTVEGYVKRGQDLVEPISLPPSVGYSSFTGNAAATNTKGVELSLNAKVIDRAVKWNVYFITNFLKDKVTRYDVPATASTFRTMNGTLVAINGKPLFGVYGYKWAGLDPTTGDPQGYLNGKVSKDYTSILNNYKTDSLAFLGSARPTKWGSLRNEVSYGGFSLSFLITYNFGYYFRMPSITGNYSDLLSQPNSDYTKRWQKPGDEKTTFVPSLVYPSNFNRQTFYTYSSALVAKADNIRLQDIRLSYDLLRVIKSPAFGAFRVYTYASNLGLLWRANKYGLDPDTYNSYPNPFSISAGVTVSFK